MMVKPRPNHVLHLILTIVTCFAWSSVWIVLTARYWHVLDYRDPRERPGMDRRMWIAIAVIVGVNIVGGVLSAIGQATGGDSGQALMGTATT